jgi:hypothetical protein
MLGSMLQSFGMAFCASMGDSPMPYTTYQAELIDMITSGNKLAPLDIINQDVLTEFYAFKDDPMMWEVLTTSLEKQGFRAARLERLIEDVHRRSNSKTPAAFPTPQTSEELLLKAFDPLRCFVDGILAEGLTILAGKPKKGKSYLALDMSLAVAVGREAFRQFVTEKTRVLYVSLEDGERRLQRRLRQIQPNLTSAKGLDFLYSFPHLGAGALEAIDHYANTYGVIIIDVIGRILPQQSTNHKSLAEYQEMVEVLGPIQQLAIGREIAVIMIDHVRKASAEDAGDTIMGSQGKFGVADHALIYSRKGEDKDGVLEVMSRDLDQEKYVLTLNDGHIEFLGKGESFETDSEQNRIIKILEEERRPMSIPDIMKAMGLGEQHYKRFRVVMHRLYNEDRLGRTKRGLYTLYGHDRHEDEDLDRIKF